MTPVRSSRADRIRNSSGRARAGNVTGAGFVRIANPRDASKASLVVDRSFRSIKQMQIWVDGDACPGEVKALLFKAAVNRKVHVTVVANQSIHTPKAQYIATVLVPSGMNIADRKIVELATSGDLVITADIPLAAEVIAKGALALNPRGELYTSDNIGGRLAMRDLMDELRGGGLITGGPSGYSAKDRQAFANQLDRWLSKKR